MNKTKKRKKKDKQTILRVTPLHHDGMFSFRRSYNELCYTGDDAMGWSCNLRRRHEPTHHERRPDTTRHYVANNAIVVTAAIDMLIIVQTMMTRKIIIHDNDKKNENKYGYKTK